MSESTTEKQCISKWISELHEEHSKWSDQQIIAVAYEKCGASKSDFTDGFCPYKVLSKLQFIEQIENQLYQEDFSELPTSIRISNAVNDHLPGLQKHFPNLEELDILKLGYDMARGILNNSDFETVEEKPIYFEIWVEDAIAFERELQTQFLSTGDYVDSRIDFTDDKAAKEFFAQDKPVTSTNVAEIGYENGKLRIFFRSGGGYEYPVPSSWYVDMLNAPSKGKFVWDTLRGRVPGRVIDNPTKITPGGVGGSIVPYFKIKGARMAPDVMRKSVRGFLKSARRGRAQVGGVPIRRIPKPEFKAFTRFLAGKAARFKTEAAPKRVFKKISKKAVGFAKKFLKKRKTEKTRKATQKEETTKKEDKTAIREQIKRLRKALANARKMDLDETIIKSMQKRLAALQKRISDFIMETKGPYEFYNIVDDFIDDMRHFYGPITRAGDFEYGSPLNPKTKTKNKDNLKSIFAQYKHLPSFDSHHENQILGFAYNFTDDPDLYMKTHPKYDDLIGKDYFFTEGFAFNDIENVSEIPIVPNETELPVSIRFLDANEGSGSSDQDISNLIHLAISVNQTDKDRCSSAGGNPCFITFHDKQESLMNMEQSEGDFMPENGKEKKKEEEEPPKDKEGDSKDKDKEKKKDSKEDKKKEDPPMDAEFKSEEKNKKDFDEDFVKIKKSEYITLNKEISDMMGEFKVMKKERNQEKAEKQQEKLVKLKSDFGENTQLYTIKSDFIPTADLATMQVLQKALVKFEAPVNARKQMFGNDFEDKGGKLQGRLEKMYGVGEA